MTINIRIKGRLQIFNSYYMSGVLASSIRESARSGQEHHAWKHTMPVMPSHMSLVPLVYGYGWVGANAAC